MLWPLDIVFLQFKETTPDNNTISHCIDGCMWWWDTLCLGDFAHIGIDRVDWFHLSQSIDLIDFACKLDNSGTTWPISVQFCIQTGMCPAPDWDGYGHGWLNICRMAAILTIDFLVNVQKSRTTGLISFCVVLHLSFQLWKWFATTRQAVLHNVTSKALMWHRQALKTHQKKIWCDLGKPVQDGQGGGALPKFLTI